MDFVDKTDRYCILGAGASGIAAGKAFQDAGIAFEIFEREDEVGGTWNYGKPSSHVYKSTHLISSKTMTAYPDFPMPEDYPDYPNHEQVCAYLRDYAHHFGIYEHIHFNTAVERTERTEAGLWDIHIKGGIQRFKGVIIANGHHWDPQFPQYPGTFNGVVIHSADYKTPDIFKDKRVLIIGAGNSGCDIAVEAAQNATKTFHSTRRGYYYAPKYVFGKPTDVINELPIRLGVPVWLRRILNGVVLQIIVGDLRNYGLRKPDHKLLSSHPIVNQQLTYFMGHGKITPKVDVAELRGGSVKFTDGSIEQIDIIVYATGYKVSFPFIDHQHLNWRDNHPDLYMHVFHRDYDNLFVIGLIQPDSGIFWIMDLQSRVVAAYIRAAESGNPAADDFRRIKAAVHPDLGGGIKYLNSTRHYLEIEHHTYRKRLKKHLRALGMRLTV